MAKRIRRVRRYQRGNQNPYIEEEQTTQWPKEKVQKDKQQSTKHTYKTKDRVTRTSLKTEGKLRCSERVSRSCYTSDTRRVALVTNPVISHDKRNITIRATVSQVKAITAKPPKPRPHSTTRNPCHSSPLSASPSIKEIMITLSAYWCFWIMQKKSPSIPFLL
jgi:hypothetical protein